MMPIYSQDKILQRICFIMMTKMFNFSHQNSSVLELIYQKLKEKVYLTSFNTNYKCVEIIGSGSFGMVN